MRRTRSMENLVMLPEEAKMAASLLRLTLSDKQETTSESDSGFQTYMRQNNQFPYHRSILIADVKRPASSPTIPINPSPIVHHPSGVNTERLQKRRVLRRRCESSPSAISSDESKAIDKIVASSLSKSAPTEGFFQRLVPAFLKRRFSKEIPEKAKSTPVIVTAAAEKKVQVFPEITHHEKEGSGHFVRQFVRMENKMDNLIFMSMR